MRELLLKKLHYYLVHNHLDLLITLQEEQKVTVYLEDKVALVLPLAEQYQQEKRPDYVIEALCLDELTKDLRPSKFEYIRVLLEDEFTELHWRMREEGILTYEIINLIGYCRPVFSNFGFTEESADDPRLRLAVIGTIHDYLSD
jgi:hypothetical protein